MNGSPSIFFSWFLGSISGRQVDVDSEGRQLDVEGRQLDVPSIFGISFLTGLVTNMLQYLVPSQAQVVFGEEESSTVGENNNATTNNITPSFQISFSLSCNKNVHSMTSRGSTKIIWLFSSPGGLLILWFFIYGKQLSSHFKPR